MKRAVHLSPAAICHRVEVPYRVPTPPRLAPPEMTQALRAVGYAFVLTWRHRWTMVLANIVACLLSLPFAAILAIFPMPTHSNALSFLLLVLLLIALPTPALAGLHTMAYDLTHGQIMFVSDMFRGLRTDGFIALKCWLISLAGTLVIGVNLEYYVRAHLAVSLFMEILWLYVLLMWLGIQLYVYPLVYEHTQKRALLIYRNAVILTASNPVFSLIATLLWLAVVGLASITALGAVIGVSVAAVMQHTSLRPRSRAAKRQRQGRDANPRPRGREAQSHSAGRVADSSKCDRLLAIPSNREARLSCRTRQSLCTRDHNWPVHRGSICGVSGNSHTTITI